MLNTRLVLAVLIVAVVTGCRELPVQSIPIEPVEPKLNAVSFGGFIDISQLGDMGRNVEVLGNATYVFSAADNDDDLSKSVNEYFDLQILTDGTLKPTEAYKPLKTPWKISGKSFDRLLIGVDNAVTLEKRYRVQGIVEEVYLTIEFEVRRDKLSFRGMRSEESD
ncbi:MAG: hypothetical protein HY562_10175 [Ignavibacteriales bacterium]|nr:hypothetical protein [Ignavibacteriales bacterium]